MASEITPIQASNPIVGHTVFAALRDTLAALYLEEEDAHVIVADAGLDARTIAFSARAQTNWHNILVEAIRQNGLDALLAIALATYGANPPLLAAYTQYRHLIDQGDCLSIATALDKQAEGQKALNPAARLPFEPETVLVVAGAFMMGSDTDDDNERPQHALKLPAYWMGKTPVTNSQYAEFLKHTKHLAPQGVGWFLNRPPQDKGNHPVIGVNWHDAMAYCTWLTRITERTYRLPTEAEWEKAARGTDGRRYPWGNEWQEQLCNVNRDDTTAVDAYPSGISPYGCLDMLGNVEEWTSTIWGRNRRQSDFPYAYRSDDGRENPSERNHVFRICRGGSFRSKAGNVHCSLRSVFGLEIASRSLGFRVVMEQ